MLNLENKNISNCSDFLSVLVHTHKKGKRKAQKSSPSRSRSTSVAKKRVAKSRPAKPKKAALKRPASKPAASDQPDKKRPCAPKECQWPCKLILTKLPPKGGRSKSTRKPAKVTKQLKVKVRTKKAKPKPKANGKSKSRPKSKKKSKPKPLSRSKSPKPKPAARPRSKSPSKDSSPCRSLLDNLRSSKKSKSKSQPVLSKKKASKKTKADAARPKIKRKSVKKHKKRPKVLASKSAARGLKSRRRSGKKTGDGLKVESQSKKKKGGCPSGSIWKPRLRPRPLVSARYPCYAPRCMEPSAKKRAKPKSASARKSKPPAKAKRPSGGACPAKSLASKKTLCDYIPGCRRLQHVLSSIKRRITSSGQNASNSTRSLSKAGSTTGMPAKRMCLDSQRSGSSGTGTNQLKGAEAVVAPVGECVGAVPQTVDDSNTTMLVDGMAQSGRSTDGDRHHDLAGDGSVVEMAMTSLSSQLPTADPALFSETTKEHPSSDVEMEIILTDSDQTKTTEQLTTVPGFRHRNEDADDDLIDDNIEVHGDY